MKLKVLFLSLVGSLCLNVHAQDWSNETYTYGELYEGFIVTKDGERTSGWIKYRNRYVMQHEIIFYRDIEDLTTKKRYKPTDLKEYGVADKVYHIMYYSGRTVEASEKAVLLKEEGCIAHYIWYDRADGYNRLLQGDNESDEDFAKRKFPETEVIWKKGDQSGHEMNEFDEKFNRTFSKIVRDYPDLATKVRTNSQGYRRQDADSIIEEYNKWCEQ